MDSLKAILKNAWDIIRQPSNNNSQVALAIAVIVVFTVTGTLAAFVYGVAARSEGWANRASGGFVAVLACVGAFSVGGMLGLLFGSPTWGQSYPVNTEKGKEGESSVVRMQVAVRPNTSLEKIAEWLTTMIVGLSLVNLRTISEEATNLSIWLTQSITGHATGNGTPGIAIALAFSFSGFLLVYLWSMRFLPNELRDSYDDLKARIEDVEAKNQRLLAEFKEKANFVVPPAKLSQIGQILKENGLEPQLCADVVSRYKYSKKADSEPMEDFGPKEKDGYRLDAKVKEAGAGKYSVEIYLIKPENSSAKKVFWLLHNSYAPDVMSECPIDELKGTVYTTMVDEAFWVGALVPVSEGSPIALALHLGEAPGIPPAFAKR